MANEQFQDFQSQLLNRNYDAMEEIIGLTCLILEQPEKKSEIVQILLGDKPKLRFKKNPLKPKKPKSGFLFFCDEKRGKLIEKAQKKNEKVVIGDIAKELGKMWKKLNQQQKMKYEEMKNQDQVRYNNELEAYNSKIYKL